MLGHQIWHLLIPCQSLLYPNKPGFGRSDVDIFSSAPAPHNPPPWIYPILGRDYVRNLILYIHQQEDQGNEILKQIKATQRDKQIERQRGAVDIYNIHPGKRE